jgi:hypothetical protein
LTGYIIAQKKGFVNGIGEKARISLHYYITTIRHMRSFNRQAIPPPCAPADHCGSSPKTPLPRDDRFEWIKRRGESNAKLHLVLTLDVFALRLDAAIFAYDIAKAIQKASEKREFRAAKSLPSAFFRNKDCANDAVPA